MTDLRPFIDAAAAIIGRHRLAPGQYARWLTQRQGAPRDLGPNPYGCADAINLLYTIGRLPRDPAERSDLASALQSMQSADDGLFREATHHPIHTTAHCTAALELLDTLPLHPLTALAPLREPEAMTRFLDQLDWQGNPWNQSHQGAGLYAAIVIVGEVDSAWQDVYFDWLSREADEHTGLWRRGCVPREEPVTSEVFPHLAGTFHYLFNHEFARRPLPYPERLVDLCLAVEQQRAWAGLGCAVDFATIDWVYCLSRAMQQSGHRFGEAMAAQRRVASRLTAYLTALDATTDEGLNDLHRLFGTVCALAELQRVLPGELKTDVPLKLVLDRRPFI